MWRSFYEKNNLAYLINNKNRAFYETNKDNLKEILIIKNNIEEIENKITNIKKIDKKLTLFWALKIPLVALLLSSFFITPAMFTDLFWVKLLLFICTSGCVLLSATSLKHFIKLYKDIKLSNKLQYDLLLEEKEKQLEKLKYLKSVSKNKTVEKVQYKTVSRSEMIKSLERKLKLIKDYSKDKDFFTSCYNTQSLHALTELYEYEPKDIIFIKSLIEEDLKNEIKENTKQNVKSKKLENKNTD